VSKKPPPFNNPFSSVKLEKPKPDAKPAPPPQKPAPKQQASDDEALMFLEAVGEVAKVKSKATRVSPNEPPNINDVRIANDDAESLAQLAELVSGEGPFDLADSDEFVEGSVQGLDPRVMQRLRKGEFAFRAHLDLHGLNKADAKPLLEKFLAESHRAGHRCVLVVTGRGLHSKDQIPVLKQNVQGWLTRGRAAAKVLGFATARPEDGGYGALYVLLRR
jgi:DNA-nicking Smr family endonuclease